MNIEQFAALVVNMRNAQIKAKTYHTEEWKMKAKSLEQKVDQTCTSILLKPQSELKF